MQAQAGCTEYNAFVVRADCIVHFRRKYLKGLLSIPCDGRGARRPLGQSFHESVGPAALYQVSAANRRDIHTNCGGHMSTLCERPRYAVFRSLMPETAALLLEWVKDKQPEDYLFPAGRLSAVPHVGRIRFYQVSVPIADRLVS